jgi:hypothetical protein
VCVRYRHDGRGGVRYTTVELVVDSGPIASRAYLNETVLVKLAFDDAKRRQSAITHGARWDVERQVWSMPRRTALKLKLSSRIVKP